MAWFDNFAKDYDSWYLTKLGSFVDMVEKNLIEEMANFKKNENVLDLGAGTGNYSIWLAEKGLKVTALDQSTEMLDIAKEKAKEKNLELNWQVSDAQSIPFASETFDAVVSVTAIEFMENPKEVLKEALRVLKPNGRIVIGVLTRRSPWGELYRRLGAENPNNLFAKAHLFTEEDVKELLPIDFKLRKGLYLSPVQNFDFDAALKMEQEKQNTQADEAGFFVIRWNKE